MIGGLDVEVNIRRIAEALEKQAQMMEANRTIIRAFLRAAAAKLDIPLPEDF